MWHVLCRTHLSQVSSEWALLTPTLLAGLTSGRYGIGRKVQTLSSWGNTWFILEGHLWKTASFHISHIPSLQGLGPYVLLRLSTTEAAKSHARYICAAQFKLPQLITPLYHQPMVLRQLPPQTLKTLFKIWSSQLRQDQPGVKTLRHDCLSREIHASK